MPIWQQCLLRAWLKRGGLAWLLWPCSRLYALALRTRYWFYQRGWRQSMRLPVPLLVVGNVVAGGSGKTPVVLALIEHLVLRGIQVGVIARGYGRQSRGCLEVHRSSTARQVGDEALLIKRRCAIPVFVAEQRSQAALALLAAHAQTQFIVSDDGLQHLGLQRDLELGVFDDRGIGNGFLLPAGPLRETWPRALNWVLHTGSHAAFAGFQARRSLATYALRDDGSKLALSALANSPKPLLAVAAIAQPEAFFDMLRAQGLHLAQTIALPDHDDFCAWSAQHYQAYQLLCTEKDAVKLWLIDATALCVPLLCELPEELLKELDTQVDRLVKPHPSGPTLDR